MSADAVQALLYVLMRDDVNPGRLEQLVMELEVVEGFEFSNPHLAAYAKELADRLRDR